MSNEAPGHTRPMTIRYAVGSQTHDIEVISGDLDLRGHVSRLDPGPGREWTRFSLPGGGEVALRTSAIIAILVPGTG
ncbi:hypothetical protein ACFXAZ_38415 [Streptomyces sp. NPDC059477]|uniref:hypothetical protein n=1 Tax=Streptomyces sp. NPDC059477 TaxID=3346847 RepID=UPI003697F361